MCVKETHMLEFYISYFFSRTSIFNTPDNNKTNSNTNIKVYFPDTSNKMQSEIFGYYLNILKIFLLIYLNIATKFQKELA